MLCSRCGEKPVGYKHTDLCRGCYGTDKALEKLSTLTIELCEGECGKRIHAIRYLKVPGVPQGHGPGLRWCYACFMRDKPRAGRRITDRGPCRRCERPMMSGKPDEGFIKHHARGLCRSCYSHFYSPSKGILLERRIRNSHITYNRQVLDATKVREIKQRLLNDESQRSLSRAFGVTRGTIHHIKVGHTWKNVKV